MNNSQSLESFDRIGVRGYLSIKGIFYCCSISPDNYFDYMYITELLSLNNQTCLNPNIPLDAQHEAACVPMNNVLRGRLSVYWQQSGHRLSQQQPVF